MEDIAALNEKIQELQNQVESLIDLNKEMLSANMKVLNIMNENANVIKLSQKMSRKGDGHPCYRTDLDTAKVVKDYLANGSRITKEMLAEYNKDVNHPITYNGLRARLKNAGVWVSREEKNGKN